MNNSDYIVYDISNPTVIHFKGSIGGCIDKARELIQSWGVNAHPLDFIVEAEVIQIRPNSYSYA